jgi:large subunit ribosomal protein L25
MKTITIEGQLRTATGKAATRQLRSEEQVPAVIYGGASEVSFSANIKSFKPLVYTSEFMLAEINVNGKTHKCVLKDLQFDKITDTLTHIDFLELVENKSVIVTLPLKYVGTPVGVKEGGKLLLKVKALKVKSTPANLRETIEVNIENLAINENIRVEDVKVDGLEIMNSARIPLASVVMTRQLKQAESEQAKAKK